MEERVRSGQVWVVQLDPTTGSETRKTRPCVVVSNDQANRHSRCVTILPVTEWSEKKATYPICVALSAESGLKKQSVADASQIRTVDKRRLGRPLGLVPRDQMTRIDRAMLIHLGIEAPWGPSGAA